MRRWKDARRARKFDYIYIYRDAFFFGTFVEKWMAKSGTRIIYDFDDAIWLKDENPNQGLFNRLKTPDKVADIIRMSHLTLVGNQYLADYALQFNESVRIIPSTVDMKTYQADKSLNSAICIGWTGSFSTLKHFQWLYPALLELKRRYDERISFKLIGVAEYRSEELGLVGQPWRSDKEAEDLAELDIGIMPLPDNKWTRGKCAMKGIQYMALGIPTVLSPVGINAEIVTDGTNGLLAKDEQEWVEKLSMLVEDTALREKLGKKGKETVLAHFTTEANKMKWLEAFSS